MNQELIDLLRGELEPAERAKLEAKLESLDKPMVSKADYERLVEAERAEMETRGLEGFKFQTNEEMLAAMGLGVGTENVE